MTQMISAPILDSTSPKATSIGTRTSANSVIANNLDAKDFFSMLLDSENIDGQLNGNAQSEGPVVASDTSKLDLFAKLKSSSMSKNKILNNSENKNINSSVNSMLALREMFAAPNSANGAMSNFELKDTAGLAIKRPLIQNKMKYHHKMDSSGLQSLSSMINSSPELKGIQSELFSQNLDQSQINGNAKNLISVEDQRMIQSGVQEIAASVKSYLINHVNDLKNEKLNFVIDSKTFGQIDVSLSKITPKSFPEGIYDIQFNTGDAATHQILTDHKFELQQQMKQAGIFVSDVRVEIDQANKIKSELNTQSIIANASSASAGSLLNSDDTRNSFMSQDQGRGGSSNQNLSDNSNSNSDARGQGLSSSSNGSGGNGKERRDELWDLLKEHRRSYA
jgi:hypothetical protein